MRILSKWILKELGWRPEGSLPNFPKYIIILVPHTSMLDFMLGQLFLSSAGMNAKTLIKKELFWFPLGILLRMLGGIPVDRSRRTQTIARMVDTFAKQDSFILAIAPEGTRKKVDAWRTGFYYMANEAGVPIIPAFCDYKRKVFGIGNPFITSGQMQEDIEFLQSFFKGVTPLHRDRF